MSPAGSFITSHLIVCSRCRISLFSHNASKLSQHGQHALAARVHAQTAPLGLSNQSAYASLSELSDALLVGCAPCILHFEGVDILYAAQQERPGQSGSGGETASSEAVDECFARIFKAWLETLRLAMSSSISPNDLSVTVVTSTVDSGRMCPSLRGLFPSALNMKECVALNASQLRTVLRGGEVMNEAVDCSSDALLAHVEACGSSHAAAMGLRQETRLTRLKAQQLPLWLHQSGLDPHLSSSTQSDLLETSLNHFLPQTVALVPCVGLLGTGVCGEGASSSTHKYATSVAPVYWSDIGGLDRWVCATDELMLSH